MSEIRAKATAGVYAEIMNQIYDSLDKRIREAVSNAYDANASYIKISVFSEPEYKIIIFDDGDGMTESELVEKYVSMGGGDNYNNPDTIGRIGIGALSVFALGDKIKVETRKMGTNSVITAALDFTPIKTPVTHAKPIGDIVLGTILPYRDANNDDVDKFTRITIESVSKEARDIFINKISLANFIEKLERILPVKYRADNPIFEKLNKDVVKNLNDPKYTIDVFLNIPAADYRNYQIFRKTVFTEANLNINQRMPLTTQKIDGGADPNLQAFGYLYINDEAALPKTWQGINARVKNVTIEGNSFFGVDEDQQARSRIGGEIFIRNINENQAIQSNRSGFAVENNDYKRVSGWVRLFIQEAITRVRCDVDRDSKVKKVVKHLASIRFVLSEVMAVQESKSDNDIFNFLGGPNSVYKYREFSIEDEIKRVLRSSNIDFEVKFTSTVDLYASQKHEDDFITILIAENLREFLFDVTGNTIEVILCYANDDDQPLFLKCLDKIYVNFNSRMIHEKPFHKVDPGFLEATLILYLNYLRNTTDATVLYQTTIEDLAK